MLPDERDYWMAFSICPGVGPKKFELLIEQFGSARNAWDATESDVQTIIGPALAKAIQLFKKNFSLPEYQQKLIQSGVWFVTQRESEYPSLLRQIDNPPFVLFGKGNKEILRDGTQCIGVVGTRKVTSYGRSVTEMMTKGFLEAGLIIISGLALGVDAVAHQTTVENKGKTIAVLGCGVDCCYPASNQAIYNSILENDGAVISEFPLGMKPSVGSFPSRNRIIAGMSTATLVTEGAEDSGSLITARNALRYGRKVFAVPGPITSELSTGPMKLIREGATLITSANEILEAIGVGGNQKTSVKKRIRGETKEEELILNLLENESLHFDELVRDTRIDASRLGIILSLMEVKGIIKNTDMGKYSLEG